MFHTINTLHNIFFSTLQNTGEIFTDGSKSEDGIGFTAVSRRNSAVSRFPPTALILTADLYATLAAATKNRNLKRFKTGLL